MITNEVETELRSAFARTADSISIPPQTRQRLLQPDCLPRQEARGKTPWRGAGPPAAVGGRVDA